MQAAQIRQLFSTSNLTQVASVAIAAILSLMQREVIDTTVVLAWFSLIALVALLRTGVARSYQKSAVSGNPSTHDWLGIFRLGVLISGIAWGSSSLLLFPANNSQHQIFLVFMLAGLTAGSLASYSVDLVSAILYNVSVQVPLIIRLFVAGDSLSIAMSASVLLYFGFIIMSFRYINRNICENILLRLEAAEREELVKVSEQRYRLLLNHSPVGIFHYNPDFVITYCNDRFAVILRNSVEDIVGLDMKILNDQSILPALRNALESGVGYFEGHYDATFSDAKGWVSMTCAQSLNGEGAIVGGIAIVQDITERKLAEELLIKQKQFSDDVINNLPGIFYMINPQGGFVRVSPRFLDVSGYSSDEIYSMSALSFFDGNDQELITQRIREVFEIGDSWAEAEFITKSGQKIPYHFSGHRTTIDDQYYLVGLGSDITERRHAEEGLRITASVFGNTQEAIVITDANNVIIDVNPAFTHITGYTREEVIGQNSRLHIISGRQDEISYASMSKSLKNNRTWRGEIWNQRKSGEVYAEMLSISAICDDNGKVLRHVAVFSDISHIKAHEAELSRVAHYDALTGIPNRVLLADRMKQAIAQTSREQNMMAVCYLDLDGFKPINDTMGHEAGDRVLVEMATRIGSTIRGGDTVARLGGDEFVVLLLELEKGEECVATLERLLAAIAQPITVKDKPLTLSVSIGVSIYPLDEEDPDTLLRHADQAMYIAKQSGKNRFHIYDPALDQRARDQHEFLKSIRHGLEHDQFELYYQPKINLRTKELVGAEALIRWRHPERGLLSPAEFLRYIDNTELDIEIGEWVTAAALARMSDWQNAGLDIEVSINISGYHLESPRFVERLQQQLAHYPDLPHGKLQIEVLETVALNDIAIVRGIIESCREFGVGFALDDFGTGYSSLSYLSALPVDTLKIDQSFVRDMLEDKGDMAIVQGIIALARAFGRETVAEGIETGDHYRVLLDMGCELGQGYGIARPMPADKLANWQASSSL